MPRAMADSTIEGYLKLSNYFVQIMWRLCRVYSAWAEYKSLPKQILGDVKSNGDNSRVCLDEHTSIFISKQI